MATPTGLGLLSALHKAASTSALKDIPETYFEGEDEKKAFEFLTKHVLANRAFPDASYFKRHTGLSIEKTTQPLAFYLNEARKRALYSVLTNSFSDMRDAVEGMDPDTVIEVARQMVRAGSVFLSKSGDYMPIEAGLDQLILDFKKARLTQGQMRGIPTGWPYLDRLTDGLQNDDIVALVGRIGVGKAQPLTAKIRALNGWVSMGNIRIGASLVSVDGRPSYVNGIFPQGVKDVFKVLFTDGRATNVCGEHLWEVFNPHWNEWRVKTTEEIRKIISKKRYSKSTAVRLIEGSFNEKNTQLPIDPWLLGVLIGDGGLTQQVTLTTASPFVVSEVRERLPSGYSLKYRSSYGYGIVRHSRSSKPNIVKDILIELGLQGKKSSEKRIPWIYMNTCKQNRIELLRGLLDTDGYISKTSAIAIAVSNKGLAYDIQELARSIGATARITLKPTTHLMSYRVCIRYHDPKVLFGVPEKLARVSSKYQYRDCLRNVIKSIEFIGREECQCISVTHPSSLYVTDEYVVTHNSYLLLSIAYAAWNHGYNVLFNSNELGNKQTIERLFGVHTRLNPRLVRSGRLSNVVAAQIDEYASSMRNGVPFNIISGGLRKSVQTIAAVAEATSPDIIFSDSAYLLEPEKKRRGSEGRRETISDVAEDLKRLALVQNRPLVLSVQFNRKAELTENRRQTADPTAAMTMGRIGETDVIGQVASIVIGVAKALSPHQDNRRWLKLMKNREGEEGVFQINYSFNPLNFDTISIGPAAAENPNVQGMV